MTFERVILEKCNGNCDLSPNESKIKEKLVEQLMKVEPAAIFTDLYALPAVHYLTTNYDNAFVDCISKHHPIEKKDLSTEDILGCSSTNEN